MQTGPQRLICKLIRMGFPGWQTRRTFRFLEDENSPAFEEFAPKMTPQEVECTRFTHLWQMDRHKFRMLLSAFVTLLEQLHVSQRVLFHPINDCAQGDQGVGLQQRYKSWLHYYCSPSSLQLERNGAKGPHQPRSEAGADHG